MVHPGPRDRPLRVHGDRVPVGLVSAAPEGTGAQRAQGGEGGRGGAQHGRDAVLLVPAAASLPVAADEDDDGDDDGAADGRRRRDDDGVHVHRGRRLRPDFAALGVLDAAGGRGVGEVGIRYL